MKVYEVVAAIIIRDGKILCAQRGEGKYPFLSYKFEFPGGKVELGETNEQAIIREIKEELNMEIKVKSFFKTVHYSYPDFQLNLHSFICTCDQQDPVPSEHISLKWLNSEDLFSLEWAPADIPIVESLLKKKLQ